MQFIVSHWPMIIAVAYGIVCETLANIPAVEANSTFQLIAKGVKALKDHSSQS